MAGRAEQELIDVAHEWDRAMIANDAEEIGRFMAEDWTIVGSDGRVGDRKTFLDLVRSGELTHDVMTSEDIQIRLYGETAVVVARGVSGGVFRSQPFREVERATSVFVRQEGRWRCVHTHLSGLAPEGR